MSIEIKGKFENMSEPGCPARWRVRHCTNVPTRWAVFYTEDDRRKWWG